MSAAVKMAKLVKSAESAVEAVPGAFHKLFDKTNTIGAMRQRIRRY